MPSSLLALASCFLLNGVLGAGDEILMPRHMDHLELVNSAATAADCTHYCQGSAGWYEHLRNAMTVVVQEVEASQNMQSQAKERGTEMSLRVCERAVASVDSLVASGVLSLVLAVLGYTAPMMVPLVVCCLHCKRG